MSEDTGVRIGGTGPYSKRELRLLKAMADSPGWVVFVEKMLAQLIASTVEIGMNVTNPKDLRDAAAGQWELLRDLSRLKADVEDALSSEAETKEEGHASP